MSTAIATRNGTGNLPAEVDQYGEVFAAPPDAPLLLAIRAEIDSAVATAKAYPRSIRHFLDSAIAMATIRQDVAKSCIYSLTRGGKQLTGKSVRLAEIVASCYGNIKVATRVVDEDTRFITAEAIAIDCQNNVSVTSQVKRRITDKNGRTYNDDMIGVTTAAALAIARRNAIFAVIPTAFTEVVYQEAVAVAVGDSQTFETTRDSWVEYYRKLKITDDRLLAALDVSSIEDMTCEHVTTLIGISNALRDKETTLDEAFPRLQPANTQPPGQSKTASLKSDLKAQQPATTSPSETTDKPKQAQANAATTPPEPAKSQAEKGDAFEEFDGTFDLKTAK